MGRQLVFAYSLAGIALAIAIVAVSASTLGFTGPGAEASGSAAVESAAAGLPEGPLAGSVAGAAVPGAGGVEYVYVDEPAPSRDYDDDEDEHHEHDDDDEREERGFLSWLRGREREHDDD
jgi:hypothetical protein